MTQSTTNDPFAAAQVEAAASTPPPAAAPAGNQNSGMAGGFGGALGSSRLFETGGSVPALFNKTHFVGTERSGIITETKDQQDRDFNAKLPKFWSLSKVGGERKDKAVTTDPIDGPTGQPNQPVIVTHITLSTDYRVTAQESAAIGGDDARIASRVTDDDGTRVEVVGGFDYKPFRDAMLDARSRGVKLEGPADLVGLRLTVTRAAQKSNPGGNPSWIKTYRLDKP